MLPSPACYAGAMKAAVLDTLGRSWALRHSFDGGHSFEIDSVGRPRRVASVAHGVLRESWRCASSSDLSVYNPHAVPDSIAWMKHHPIPPARPEIASAVSCFGWRLRSPLMRRGTLAA